LPRHPAVEHKALKLRTSSSLRSIHTSLCRLADAKSPSDPRKDGPPASPHNDAHATESTAPPPRSENGEQEKRPPDTTLHPHPWENYPVFIRRLLSASLPHVHRPTKDELLAVATGWWERLKIRFKWLMIRGFRKFNTDDLSAFVSWVVVGNAIWIVIGT
jgi:distribution and morphology protein 31